MVQTWSWLGDHLAVDLANTVRRRGMRYIELLRTPADLDAWLAHEVGRVPAPAAVDEAVLADVLAVREVALPLLRAAAAGAELLPDQVEPLNALVQAHPAVRLLAPGQPGHWTNTPLTAPDASAPAGPVAGPAAEPTGAADARAREPLVAALVAAVVDLLTLPDAGAVALCDAPGCGQLYHRGRPNQQWCGPGCGARARSERHVRGKTPQP